MTEKYKQRIHLIYDCILSVMLIVAGICLMVACVGIYRSGAKPFSPESVAAAFRGIAVPVYLCLALIAGGFILEGFLPRGKKKTVPEKQYRAILSRLLEKLDIEHCDAGLRSAILGQETCRRIHKWVSLGLLTVGSIVFLCYGANPANFHSSEITESMKKAMFVLLPCMAVPFGYSIFAAYHEKVSLQKEIGLVKQALESGEAIQVPAKKVGSRSLLLARCVILAIAIGILVYGFFAGGTNDVLTKAINICTECVGLG